MIVPWWRAHRVLVSAGSWLWTHCVIFFGGAHVPSRAAAITDSTVFCLEPWFLGSTIQRAWGNGIFRAHPPSKHRRHHSSAEGLRGHLVPVDALGLGGAWSRRACLSLCLQVAGRGAGPLFFAEISRPRMFGAPKRCPTIIPIRRQIATQTTRLVFRSRRPALLGFLGARVARQ